MSHTISTFLGSAFSFESIVQIGASTIRLRYTQDPLATNPAGANDATNPANYDLSGPGPNSIVAISTVFGDPQAVDIALSVPLITGTWILTGHNNLTTATAETFVDPKTLNFVVTIVGQVEPVPMGAVNDDCSAILRKHFNPAFKGPNWTAVLEALCFGDSAVSNLAKASFDQLFIATASGKWLTRRAADQGINKPPGVGMSDDLFREFAIRLHTGQVTYISLMRILEIIYGTDATRAELKSGLAEPFAIADESTLNVTIDGTQSVVVQFHDADFSIPSQASALEVAVAITRALRLEGLQDAYALPFTEPAGGAVKVKVFSPSLGLGSSVQVTGGSAQNALQFTELLNVYVV